MPHITSTAINVTENIFDKPVKTIKKTINKVNIIKDINNYLEDYENRYKIK